VIGEGEAFTVVSDGDCGEKADLHSPACYDGRTGSLTEKLAIVMNHAIRLSTHFAMI
jgi:hypothetical protein